MYWKFNNETKAHWITGDAQFSSSKHLLISNCCSIEKGLDFFKPEKGRKASILECKNDSQWLVP